MKEQRFSGFLGTYLLGVALLSCTTLAWLAVPEVNCRTPRSSLEMEGAMYCEVVWTSRRVSTVSFSMEDNGGTPAKLACASGRINALA